MKEIEREKKLSFAETNMFLCKELLLNFFLKKWIQFDVSRGNVIYLFMELFYSGSVIIIKSFDRKTKNT